ncbi:MAG TPA: glutamine-hydrolyzing GMP synthase [Candidatus Thermoplasmatota archaeon]|nr:glutamine-hydrolyzing GMP synthase [Candidatus Thermoplasmatota archaeon]
MSEAMVFDPAAFVEEQVAAVRKQVGTRTAVIAVSGGVDSTIAAAIVHTAIGKQLHAVYVDTGFMRKGESDDVEAMYKRMGLNLTVVHAGDEYFAALDGITEPERKRKVIGEKFIRIFERESKKTGAKVLVQGTIAPDWIESGGGNRDTIKSHHNVGGLPKDMQLELCEPLYHLYKDEVRAVARHLKVEVAERQPFPGPGLAVRVIGLLTRERVQIAREACAVVEHEIDVAVKAGKMERPWQYFAVLSNTPTVGVQGDIRAYGETVAVRAVHSFDAMTATAVPIPFDVLGKIARGITNHPQLKDKVNRVVYDITDKPPATVEWE